MKKQPKEPRWRQAQTKKRRRELRRWLWFGLLLIGLISFSVFINQLWQKAKMSVWDGRSNFSFIRVEGEKISLESYRPETRRWLEFLIPAQTYIQLPFGYGDYQLKNVYQLGELENKGGELLQRTVQDMMAVPVQGWLVNSAEAKVTNLSWWDDLRLSLARIWGVKKKIEFKLEETAGLRKDSLRDGTQVYRVEERFLDELINQEFFDQRMIDEGLAVAIVNSSGVSGMAATAGRLASNLGNQVVWLGNEDGIRAGSEVWVSRQNLVKSLTSQELARAFGIKTIKQADVSAYRAEVVVVLGTDYALGR
jgi:hypothetical protein